MIPSHIETQYSDIPSILSGITTGIPPALITEQMYFSCTRTLGILLCISIELEIPMIGLVEYFKLSSPLMMPGWLYLKSAPLPYILYD
jgi:hypothetical protein